MSPVDCAWPAMHGQTAKRDKARMTGDQAFQACVNFLCVSFLSPSFFTRSLASSSNLCRGPVGVTIMDVSDPLAASWRFGVGQCSNSANPPSDACTGRDFAACTVRGGSCGWCPGNGIMPDRCIGASTPAGPKASAKRTCTNPWTGQTQWAYNGPVVLALVDPCYNYSSSCTQCNSAPLDYGCGFCSQYNECRSGSAYLPDQSMPLSACNAWNWYGPTASNGHANCLTAIAYEDDARDCVGITTCSACMQEEKCGENRQDTQRLERSLLLAQLCVSFKHRSLTLLLPLSFEFRLVCLGCLRSSALRGAQLHESDAAQVAGHQVPLLSPARELLPSLSRPVSE